ncbi:MAG: hypothetical protein A2Y10_07780 [Planctomycetes bacterium GWF2_41_51]|nr:MAG: hypothetical protein A2Y10_07780 [Planctomycetes bacterium GWF2_41_51]HBG26836.1 hypothetical protein [Phycisphaerales bacterium]
MAEQNLESESAAGFKMDNLLFPKIFKLFKIAVQPGRIMTAFFALMIIFLAGWVMDFHKTVVVSGRISEADLRISTLSGSPAWPTELHCFVGYPERVDNYIMTYKERQKSQMLGVFKVFSSFCIANFNEGVVYLLNLKFDRVIAAVTNCILACVWVLKYHTIYGIFFLVISFVVLALAGGAISRGAALQFARDEKAGMRTCIGFAIKNFIPIFCAPTAPLVLVALLGFVIVWVIGLLTNIPYAGELIMALFFLLVLIAGGLMAFTTIWAGASLNLMFGAIGFDKSDTFDAICRSYNYVYSRPWRLGLYTLLAAFYGGVCYLFVRLFAYVMLVMSRWFLQLGVFSKSEAGRQFDKVDAIWPKPEYFNFLGAMDDVSRPVTQTIASAVVHFEILIIAGLIMAFVVSYYFSAGTVIYCLLRKKVDNTAIEKVYIETPTQTQTTEQA